MNNVIRQSILDIICSILEKDNIEIKDESRFIEDLDFDSVSIITFMAMIEEKFHIQFSENDNMIEIFNNVFSLEQYLHKKV